MKEDYISIRKGMVEAILRGQQPAIPVEFFYKYYLECFNDLPKTRMVGKRDGMGNFIFDSNGELIFEEIETQQIPLPVFVQKFGLMMMACFEEVMEIFDKKFNISWLEDKDGRKIKLVV